MIYMCDPAKGTSDRASPEGIPSVQALVLLKGIRPFAEFLGIYTKGMSDSTVFPMIFGLKGLSFEWVFNNKKEFVDFTISEMKKATGLFIVWQKYCKNKIKLEKCRAPRSKLAKS